MAMYTFYLCNLGGGADSFEAFELGSDRDAPARALKMLQDHPSCTYVAVWAGDRAVLDSHRGSTRRPGARLGVQAESPFRRG